MVGWDGGRLAMVLAVLESHCGVKLGPHDVYLAVAGGLRINEPAADLAVAAALVSSLSGIALPADCVYFGEVSLSGAVRPVVHAAQRLKEAQKLGFAKAVLPLQSLDKDQGVTAGLVGIDQLAGLVAAIAASGPPTGRPAQRETGGRPAERRRAAIVADEP